MSQAILQRLESDDYDTPRSLFDVYEKLYGPYDLDAAASPANAKAPAFFTKSDDALTKEWNGVVWCNPPFSRLLDWTNKAMAEVKAGRATRVVMCLPVHTKTAWFHDVVLPNAKIHWVRGGVKFGGCKHCAIASIMVVVFE